MRRKRITTGKKPIAENCILNHVKPVSAIMIPFKLDSDNIKIKNFNDVTLFGYEVPFERGFYVHPSNEMLCFLKCQKIIVDKKTFRETVLNSYADHFEEDSVLLAELILAKKRALAGSIIIHAKDRVEYVLNKHNGEFVISEREPNMLVKEAYLSLAHQMHVIKLVDN